MNLKQQQQHVEDLLQQLYTAVQAQVQTPNPAFPQYLYDELLMALETLETDVEQTLQQMDDPQRTLQARQQELQDYEERLAALENIDVQALQKEVDALKAALSEAGRDRAMIESARLMRDYADQAREKANNLAQIEAKIEASKQAIQQLKQRQTELRQHIRDTEEKLAGYQHMDKIVRARETCLALADELTMLRHDLQSKLK